MHKLNEKSSNIISAFKSTGIHPFNPDKVINKLPDSTPQSEYSIDNALLQFLKENRAPDPIKKVWNKKLSDPPGKSVRSIDFEDALTKNDQQKKLLKATPSVDQAGSSGVLKMQQYDKESKEKTLCP